MKNKTALISMLGLAVIGILAYWINIRAGFVFDDYKVIVLNPAIRHLGDFASIWRFDPTRLIPSLTFALNYRMTGFETFSYHLVNIIFHVMTGWLVYWLVSLLMTTPVLHNKTDISRRKLWPLLAALIFIIHPIQTSTVSYIVQRSTIMFSFFYLLSIASYLKWRLMSGRRFFYLGFLSVLMGSLCKPTMVTLPFVLILIEAFFLKSQQGQGRPRKALGLVAFSAAVLIVPALLALLKEISPSLGNFVSITRQTAMVSRWEYLTTQFNVIIYYIGLLFMPLKQNLDYGFPFAQKFFEWPTFFSFSVLWFIVYMIYRSRHRLIFSFAALWFLVTLLPESSIFPLEDALFEHRLYLPMAGFALALSYFIVFKIHRKYVRFGISLAIILLLSYQTINRNALWAEPEMLMRDNIAKSPFHLRPRFNLSSHYLREGKIGQARQVIDEAIGVAPWHPDNYYKLAVIEEMSGDIESAQRYYQQAIDLDPGIARGEYYLKRAQYFINQQQWDQAEPLLKEALERSPKSDIVHTELGNLYNIQGDMTAAFKYYQQAVEYNPYNHNALNGLATVFVMRGEHDRGIEIYQNLIEIAPEMELAQLNLAKVYFLKKDWENARIAFNQVVASGSLNPEVYVRLGQININLKNYADAQDQMVKAIRLYQDQGLKDVADQLQQQYFANGLPPEYNNN